MPKKKSELLAYLSSAGFAAIFPTLGYLHGINPRNDSVNKFDNIIFFARVFNSEKQIPIWSTLNFGSFTSLENLGLRPEETFSIMLGRLFEIDSILLLIYFTLFLALVIMNLCFASVCKDLGIQKQGVILALILVLNFVAFPMTQYWLHFQVIFFTVILMRIYLSLGMHSLKDNICLLIPVSFIAWGGYQSILPAVALAPFVLLGMKRRSRLKEIDQRFREKIIQIGFLITSLFSLLIFTSFILLYLSENRVDSPGRSSAGIATLDSYLSAAGSGISKYFELLGAPTVWQDTHLVISPLFIPLLGSFILFRFRSLVDTTKKDFMILLITSIWVVLLTLPVKSISSFVFTYFPILRLTRYPGFQMGILIPILLLILGMIYAQTINNPVITEDLLKSQTKSKKRIGKSLTKKDIDFKFMIRQTARMHLFAWTLVIFLYLSGYLPYPLIWTRVFLGHLFSPYVLVLSSVFALLLINLFHIQERRSCQFSYKFPTLDLIRLRMLFISLSSVIIFSLGIFQMYFLSFVNLREISEFKANKNAVFIDNNLIARERIETKLEGQVIDWKSLTADQQSALVTEVRKQEIDFEIEPIPMRLIDTDMTARIRIEAFDEFKAKTFIDEVLNEKYPSELIDPSSSSRSYLRKSNNIGGNFVSSSAYALNQDYCPALGIVFSVSKSLSPAVVNSLNYSAGKREQTCSGSKFHFLDNYGGSADHWIESASLNIRNGSAEIKLLINEGYVGRLITVVYRDAYSRFWIAQINGVQYNLQSTIDGFKSTSYTLREVSNTISFELGIPLKLLANSRLILDPLLYLGMIYFLVRSFKDKSQG